MQHGLVYDVLVPISVKTVLFRRARETPPQRLRDNNRSANTNLYTCLLTAVVLCEKLLSSSITVTTKYRAVIRDFSRTVLSTPICNLLSYCTYFLTNKDWLTDRLIDLIPFPRRTTWYEGPRTVKMSEIQVKNHSLRA